MGRDRKQTMLSGRRRKRKEEETKEVEHHAANVVPQVEAAMLAEPGNSHPVADAMMIAATKNHSEQADRAQAKEDLSVPSVRAVLSISPKVVHSTSPAAHSINPKVVRLKGPVARTTNPKVVPADARLINRNADHSTGRKVVQKAALLINRSAVRSTNPNAVLLSRGKSTITAIA